MLIFCSFALTNIEKLSQPIDAGFNFSTKYFGLIWQCLLLLNFIISILVLMSPKSQHVIGNFPKAEFSFFKWLSMIMCTLLAGGGVFWATGEPIAHFLTPPPLFKGILNPADRAIVAMSQSFLHWGFLAWSILGSLASIVLMHYHYEKKLPLLPRTLLYPLFKEKAIDGTVGSITDSLCSIAVIAGTVGPIGFYGLQTAYGLEKLFTLPDNYLNEIFTIIFLCMIYIASSITGIKKGIQILSRVNVILAVFVLFFVLFSGPTEFIVNTFFSAFKKYILNFFQWLCIVKPMA